MSKKLQKESKKNMTKKNNKKNDLVRRLRNWAALIGALFVSADDLVKLLQEVMKFLH